MKLKNMLYLCLVTLGLLLCGCARNQDGGKEEDTGYLSLEVSRNDVAVEVKSDAYIYTVSIVDAAGNAVATYTDHTSMPEKIKLAAGKYKIVATHGSNVSAGFEAPYFRGEKEVTIVANTTVVETIVCTLANIKVTVTYSDAIKNNFSTYDVVIDNGQDGIITYTKNDEGREGYLKVPDGDNKTISWNLNLVNNQGEIYTATRTITGVKARDFYKFHFDINQNATENEGAFGLDINVDDSLDEIEHDYDINLKKKAAPVITGDGFDVTSSVLVNETLRGASVKVNIVSEATLQDLSLKHSDEYLLSLGIPKSVSFVTSESSVISLLSSKGITASSPVTDAAEAWVDFSALANSLPLGEYQMTVVAYDAQRQQVTQTVTILVLPDQDHMPTSSDPWGQFATINGQWNTIDQPAGLTFQYRADGAETWNTVAVENITYDATAKTITTKLHALSPSTKYLYRTYSDAAGASETELTFTTEATPTIANLSFDTWSQDGETYYPNSDASNSLWATGNEGTKLAGKGSTTTPTEDVAVSGENKKAAYMKSVGGVMVAKHAAGNLYLGTYKTNLSNPRSSAVMGRPYTGRPIAMTGWYKYTPKPITIDKDNLHADVMGQSDKCHIYITLEDWGSATTRPDNPTVIAHGELLSDQTVTEYTKFKIVLTYNDTRTRPTHITIAATTSYLGGDFCGGEGCELYVDEFELLFDDAQ